MNDDERELLSDLSTLRPHLRDGTDAYPTPGESFFSSGSVAVLGDGPYKLFRKCVAGVHQVMRSEAKLVGHKTIAASILEVLWALEGRAPDRSTLAAVRERLRGDALEDWTVSRLLRGARLDGENVVHLGPFTIWETPTHAPQLTWANEHASEAHMLKPKDAERAIIATVTGVRVRDEDRAEELGDEQFQRLDNILNYMLRWSDLRCDVSIFEFKDRERRSLVLSSPTRTVSGSALVGAIETLSLDDPALQSTMNGNAQIWAICGNPGATDIQKRLLTAAEWIGKSRRDADHAKAFTQIVFALEAILQHQERGVLVSPSLTYRMAETCAYLLGSSQEGRLRVAADVNEIYGARAGIVHAGKTDVSEELRFKALSLVSILIFTLLTDPSFCKISSSATLSEWVGKRKYE